MVCIFAKLIHDGFCSLPPKRLLELWKVALNQLRYVKQKWVGSLAVEDNR